jgi:hypothetical protein
MDYPRRERLKILGHARVMDAREYPGLTAELTESALAKNVERLFVINVVSFDWNCAKYITPRFTEDELWKIVEPLKKRIAELEGQMAKQD